MDQLYRSTKGGPDDGGELTQGPHEPAAGHSTGGGIMAGLPHRRPQRRNARRDRYREPAPAQHATGPVTSSASGSGAIARRAHLSAVPDARAVAALPRRRGESKRSRLPAPKEPAPGIRRLALDGARETAKLPFRVAEHFTRQALVTVARGLRRD